MLGGHSLHGFSPLSVGLPKIGMPVNGDERESCTSGGGSAEGIPTRGTRKPHLTPLSMPNLPSVCSSLLPPMQRACFELVTIRGLSTHEVAAMHGISESTVRQHVFRARASLRDHLGSTDGSKS